MQRSLLSRRTLLSLACVFLLVVTTLGVFLFSSQASAATANYVPLSSSFNGSPAGAHLHGSHSSKDQLTITLVLQPNNVTAMNTLLTALYNPHSNQFHHWLSQGAFNRLFAPTASQAAQVQTFLKKAGLKLASSPSPFLIRATGTTAQIDAAFLTTIDNYTAADGQPFFQNASAIQVPSSLSNLIVGVTGLSSTAQLHPNYVTTRQAAQQAGKAVPHYGAGPGGSGLTPSQTSGIYDANPIHALGSAGQGKGATLAVFELSGYTASDITAYEHQFFGSAEHVAIQNINVDGGPIHPICPTGDECGPFDTGSCINGCDSADYSGDIEVEADVETQIALDPQINRILVYNAPNDALSITSLDEYFQIANDDKADAISTSWGLCETDLGLAGAQAESIAFTEMAVQGQSIFDAAGDTGAFDCLEGSGNTALTAEDPSTQPFVTSVGGTSFESFDPGSNKNPSYPQGFETIWNPLASCSASNLTGCLNYGAGGGGVSRFWPMPSYQSGAGVISSFSQKAPYCSQATKGEYCREVPDVSANADEYTPYAELCTGNPATNSTCAQFSASQPAPGWFGIGGTSLSSPLWSGIIGLWDSVHGARFGSANYGLYQLFRSSGSYSKYYHDITGKNQTENNNGYYPTTSNYDLATGIGTPRIAGIVDADF